MHDSTLHAQYGMVLIGQPNMESKMNLNELFRVSICGCGSGEPSREVCDARGIYLCRVCDKCEREKLSGYRSDVLGDAGYWHDEPIDE